MKALVLGVAASVAVNLGALRLLPPQRRDPIGMRLHADSAVEDAGLMGLGMRRLAADLGLMRLLVYYGTPEDKNVVREEPGSHPFTGRHDVEKSYGGGVYRELGPRAERVLDIDPTFTYVALYASGALAFNLNRPDEALEVLRYALARDPENLELKTYVAAIGFHVHGDAEEVIRVLEPTLSRPDCPTMIKSMVAFLLLRQGRKQEAIRLYRDIIETSRDPGYVSTSRRMLDGLGAAQP